MTSQFRPVANVQIRIAAMDESQAIASVLRQAFIEYEPLYTPAAFAVTAPTSGQIQERWNEGPVWVAVQTEGIIGTVAAVPKGSGLYVRSMAVLPIAAGRGIGTQLLEEIRHFAVSHHHRSLFLSTTPFLNQAIHLYERFGFQRNDEGPHALFGTPLFTMIKLLESAD